MDSKILTKTESDLRSSLQHFQYSFAKVEKLGILHKKNWTEEELEIMESFSSRFARTSDLFISRFLRARALKADPAFRGSIIDLLNFAEKEELIESSQIWIRIRELGNVAARDYSPDDMRKLYAEVFSLGFHIIKIATKL